LHVTVLGYCREEPSTAPIGRAGVIYEGRGAGRVGRVVRGLEVWRDPYRESRLVTTAVLHQNSKPVVPHL
jgi:hypothetical protein